MCIYILDLIQAFPIEFDMRAKNHGSIHVSVKLIPLITT